MSTIKINKLQTQITIKGQVYQKLTLSKTDLDQNKFIKYNNIYYYLIRN